MSDQFGYVRKSASEVQNIGRKPQINTMNLPQRSRKLAFPGEEEDNEASQFFASGMFRPDKDMNPGILSSQSPSQLTGFSAGNFYTSAGNLTLPQRPIGSGQFRNNTGTPTSMNPNFPIGLQQAQQHSPNSISAIGPRNILGSQTQSSHLNNLQKRSTIGSSFGAPGPMTSYSTFGFGSSRSIDSHPTLDLSDFPSLSSRSSVAPNPVPANRTYVGMVSKPPQESAPEFNITQEEFPALPGSQNPPSQSSDPSSKTPTSTPTGFDPMSNKDGSKFTADKLQGGQPKRGIQTHPDGMVTNIPQGMVADQFGIVGLLTFIRAAENDHNLVALAPGIDLTTLGLNLNSPENLYSTFQSPWADAPCRPQDIDFHVPAEYLTNIFIREKLAPIKLNRYGEDLLFFLFYMNGGDVLQLAAAAELYNRDWRYHKEERVWMTRAPGMDPIHKTNVSERGTYYFFDAQNWRKVAKDFHLEYDKLEDRPTLPTTLHHNPNMPTQPH
ncbi:CCR4-NOT transcription complex subunit 2-like isoform X1 [Pomacea canaliculata]|uniref:CCR4-NOT transcription complex subunit 2-like isoform X1 n=2 Tax=Pomacea canaliculata TaxID=400727 RepID=UPI000D7360F8|nr:CCR4-NOT transcription complex subunit 2-like isoform X1 [Pomacea canaliculata]